MSRTFITQRNPKLDYSKAGDLQTTIFPQRLQIMDAESVREALGIAETILKDFYPPEDLLLLSGDPAAMAICIGILARDHGAFSMLKYDRRDRDYYPLTINF